MHKCPESRFKQGFFFLTLLQRGVVQYRVKKKSCWHSLEKKGTTAGSILKLQLVNNYWRTSVTSCRTPVLHIVTTFWCVSWWLPFTLQTEQRLNLRGWLEAVRGITGARKHTKLSISAGDAGPFDGGDCLWFPHPCSLFSCLCLCHVRQERTTSFSS